MCLCLCCFFFKQKTASELRISDGSSDVCSSDLLPYGLWIERDLSFKTTFPLTIWAEWARRAGSILWAETLLRRASQTGEDPDLPHRSSEPDGGCCAGGALRRQPGTRSANPGKSDGPALTRNMSMTLAIIDRDTLPLSRHHITHRKKNPNGYHT